jgi:ATP-dependent protease HslVU (ClpYQ) peptidase subunit
MDDNLQSTRRMAQEALAEYDRQDSLLAGFAGRLATAEHLLATFQSQRDEMQHQHQAFIASVERSLFNPQRDFETLKLKVKA